MKLSISEEALKEIKSVAEREKIKNLAVYLDLGKSCCGLTPKVDVVEQASNRSEILTNVNGVPIFACDLIRDLFKEDEKRNSLELKVDFLTPYGLIFQFLNTSDVEGT
jgi:hypothetical protein